MPLLYIKTKEEMKAQNVPWDSRSDRPFYFNDHGWMDFLFGQVLEPNQFHLYGSLANVTDDLNADLSTTTMSWTLKSEHFQLLFTDEDMLDLVNKDVSDLDDNF